MAIASGMLAPPPALAGDPGGGPPTGDHDNPAARLGPLRCAGGLPQHVDLLIFVVRFAAEWFVLLLITTVDGGAGDANRLKPDGRLIRPH